MRFPEWSTHKKNAVIFITAGAVLGVSAIALVILLFTHAGKPDEAACKNAMRAGYAQALAHPDGPAQTEPAACKGIPASELSKIAQGIMSAAPLPSGNVTACRAFAGQLDYARRHLATLTPADAEKITEGLSSDVLLSTGKLHDDFSALSDIFTLTSGGNPDIAESAVQNDCTQLGITTGN